MTHREEFKMKLSKAIGIAITGLSEAEDETEVYKAWQLLVDTGIVWQLEGRVGRTATALIQAGKIKEVA